MTPFKGFLVCASLLAFAGTAARAEGETDNLQMAFNNSCRTCHSFKEGDNRLGPSLHGVVGRKSGTLEGFAFSPAMKSANITWDEQTLDQFIANPDHVVSGNAMKPFTGISDAKQRGEIIAYLKTLGGK
jgi:cytochrome c